MSKLIFNAEQVELIKAFAREELNALLTDPVKVKKAKKAKVKKEKPKKSSTDRLSKIEAERLRETVLSVIERSGSVALSRGEILASCELGPNGASKVAGALAQLKKRGAVTMVGDKATARYSLASTN